MICYNELSRRKTPKKKPECVNCDIKSMHFLKKKSKQVNDVDTSALWKNGDDLVEIFKLNIILINVHEHVHVKTSTN